MPEHELVSPAALGEEDIRQIVRSELALVREQDTAPKKAAFIASKGTLDWAYPPLILATTAAASGMDASVFFTFYGLNIIHKDFERLLKVAPLGNPAMPMPVPMPNLVLGLPGMGPVATACPFGAISLVTGDGGQIAAIDPAGCKGCGACAPVCPEDAIDLLGYTDAQVHAMIDGLLTGAAT